MSVKIRSFKSHEEAVHELRRVCEWAEDYLGELISQWEGISPSEMKDTLSDISRRLGRVSSIYIDDE